MAKLRRHAVFGKLDQGASIPSIAALLSENSPYKWNVVDPDHRAICEKLVKIEGGDRDE